MMAFVFGVIFASTSAAEMPNESSTSANTGSAPVMRMAV